MRDFLVELGENPTARQLVKNLGLPVPLPHRLSRAPGPWEAQPLRDRAVLVGAGPKAELLEATAATLAACGARVCVVGEGSAVKAFEGPAEAHGRPLVSEDDLEGRFHGLVIDGSGLSGPADLRVLYDVLQPRLARLAASGRVIVLGRPAAACKKPARRGAMAALEGFVRSLSKETGKRGATVQAVFVASGAEGRLPDVLRFFLSDRAAYVTGQPLHVTKQVRAAADTPTVQPLDGKVALVTGAARGIGAATARRMAAEGAKVIVLDRPADDGPASQVAEAIGGVPLLEDLTTEGAADRIAEWVVERFDGLDILVNNAGITRDKTLLRMKPEQWDQCVAVNFQAVVDLTERLRGGVLRSEGRVVCLSSVSGLAGNYGQTNYSASKAGVVGYVQGLASPLARRGVAVNAVAPGFIETRLTAAMPPVQREVARRVAAVGQGGLPVDVAEVVTFLSSPGAQGLTGQVVRVCGGNMIGA